MRFDVLRQKVRQAGFLKAVGDYALRATNRVALVKILKAVKIDSVDPTFLSCDQGFTGLFLTREMLEDFVGSPAYELSKDFLAHAFDKGDECYGFLNGDVLAAYGWYSNQPTEIDVPALQINFDPKYIYMYKGFTEVHNRGHRLHAVGMTRALEAYLSRGYKGIVSYVEWNNFSSLKSCYRMGYRDFGVIFLLRLFNRFLIVHSKGCKQCQFRLEIVDVASPSMGVREEEAAAVQ